MGLHYLYWWSVKHGLDNTNSTTASHVCSGSSTAFITAVFEGVSVSSRATYFTLASPEQPLGELQAWTDLMGSTRSIGMSHPGVDVFSNIRQGIRLACNSMLEWLLGAKKVQCEHHSICVHTYEHVTSLRREKYSLSVS